MFFSVLFQCKLRSERERELVMLQKKIIACPVSIQPGHACSNLFSPVMGYVVIA